MEAAKHKTACLSRLVDTTNSNKHNLSVTCLSQRTEATRCQLSGERYEFLDVTQSRWKSFLEKLGSNRFARIFLQNNCPNSFPMCITGKLFFVENQI